MTSSLAALAVLVAQVHPVTRIEAIVEGGITAGVYPGAVVVVGTSDTVLMSRGYGRFTWSEESPRPTPDSTLWDLASLTKVVATTPAIMRLVDRGRVHLSDPVRTYVPDFVGPGKDEVTVEHLLAHTSGLRAFLSLPDLAQTSEEARALVVSEALQARPGAQVVYSDLNAMLAGWVVEGATGLTLDEFVRDSVHRPLGMFDTRFRLPKSEYARAAPVGRWRGHAVAGTVHDQNAEILGRVSGHAGLFSTGADLARYAQFYLSWGKVADRDARLVDSATVAEFIRRRDGNRALGWEVNDTTSSGHTGDYLSPAAIGHGGFTGTSIWIDPELDLFVILLTNRVFAPRTRRSISQLRRIRGDLADAAVQLRDHACEVLRRYSDHGRETGENQDPARPAGMKCGAPVAGSGDED